MEEEISLCVCIQIEWIKYMIEDFTILQESIIVLEDCMIC